MGSVYNAVPISDVVGNLGEFAIDLFRAVYEHDVCHVASRLSGEFLPSDDCLVWFSSGIAVPITDASDSRDNDGHYACLYASSDAGLVVNAPACRKGNPRTRLDSDHQLDQSRRGPVCHRVDGTRLVHARVSLHGSRNFVFMARSQIASCFRKTSRSK